MVIGVIMCIPFLGFKTLKEISVFSVFGVFTIFFVVGVVIYSSILEIITTSNPSPTKLFDTNEDYNYYFMVNDDYDGVGGVGGGGFWETHKWIDVLYLPQTIATISFGFAGNYVFPETEKSMKKPKEFHKVVKWAISIVSIVYFLTAVLGYTAYGDKTKSPVYYNFDEDGVLTLLCIWFTSISRLLAVPMMLTSLSLGLERKFGIENSSNEAIKRLSLRFSMLVFIVIVSMTIPYFSDVMEFIGAFCNSLLIFVIPVVLEWKIFGFRNGTRTISDMFVGVFILVLGLVVFFVGSFRTLVNLYDDILKDSSRRRH